MFKVRIETKEQLDACWSDWFSGLEISYTPRGNTIIKGDVQDSAAFYGILTKLRDLGLKLLLVYAQETDDMEGNILERGR